MRKLLQVLVIPFDHVRTHPEQRTASRTLYGRRGDPSARPAPLGRWYSRRGEPSASWMSLPSVNSRVRLPSPRPLAFLGRSRRPSAPGPARPRRTPSRRPGRVPDEGGAGRRGPAGGITADGERDVPSRRPSGSPSRRCAGGTATTSTSVAGARVGRHSATDGRQGVHESSVVPQAPPPGGRRGAERCAPGRGRASRRRARPPRPRNPGGQWGAPVAVADGVGDHGGQLVARRA